MLDSNDIHRIRTIFLHPSPHVSIADATVLLGWARGKMADAVRAGEIEVKRSALGKWIWREELIAKALEVWSLETIEEALGSDADRVLPASIRLVDLHVRIPRHHAVMLEHFAESRRTSVSDVLSRELDGVASANAEELSASIAGFGSAMQWLDADAAQLPC